MSDETGPCGIYGHVAVCLEQYIITFGGYRFNRPASTHIIWMYNLYTEKWKKYELPSTSEAPHNFFADKCAVAIGSDVYLFDGRTMFNQNPGDALWKLTRTLEGNICWNRVTSAAIPSYRCDYSGWEYEGKMWIFGGCLGIQLGNLGYCYELLCFNPSQNEWTKPKCSGSVPTPRNQHATTQVKDKVWLFGGANPYILDDLFELDMKSCTWTKIQIAQPRLATKLCLSLNAITESKLLRYGGTLSNAWILDVPSKSWTQCSLAKGDDNKRISHTGTTGLNNCVVRIGGRNCNNNTFSLRLEPKSLQQLAAQTIDKHQTLIRWQNLPNKLISQLGY